MAVAVPTFTLGDRLAKARSLAGISAQEMANQLGVSRNTISNYENDRTTPPRSVVILYAELCDVPEWWLLGEPITKSGTIERYKSGRTASGVTDGQWLVPWLMGSVPVAA
jgi:transcriptional regulator with XRE-family HTH domain